MVATPNIRCDRYTFNGMERDDEVKGSGNSYDYKYRFYDNRLVRFLSVDRLNREYPDLSSYQFAANQVIIAMDVDGKEPLYLIDKNGRLTKPVIEVLNIAFGYDKQWAEDTKWTNHNSFNSQTLQENYDYYAGKSENHNFKKNVKRLAANNAIDNRNMNAITLGHDVIYNQKLIGDFHFTPQNWLGLISHEHSHGEDYRTSGTNTFLIDYLSEATYTQYENITTESKAYAIGTIMSNYLKSDNGKKMMQILADPNKTDEEKMIAIKPYAVKLRISYLNDQIGELEGAIEKIQTNMDSGKLLFFKQAEDIKRNLEGVLLEKTKEKEELENRFINGETINKPNSENN